MPMKHVETTAPRDGRRNGPRARHVLVTGFGAFPGAPSNPSAAILRALACHRGRLARLGIVLETVLLPVVYDAIEPAMSAQTRRLAPDAILHVGLAGRRRMISVETRALNRAGPLHPDAARKRPAQVLAPHGPAHLSATYPAARIRAAIAAAGVPAERSIDAGDYVCNATLYRTLARDGAPLAGFLHMPRPRNLARPQLPVLRGRPKRPRLDDLTRGVLAAIVVLANEVTRSKVHRARLYGRQSLDHSASSRGHIP